MDQRKRENKNGKSGERAVTCLIIGGGQRGSTYAAYALDFPAKLQVVGIADPRESVRKRFQQKYTIDEKMIFSDWSQVTSDEMGRLADVVCICTPDILHKEIAVAMAKRKYHILLEKPMATTEADCREIAVTCRANDVMLSVCHVLRYFPGNRKLRELIESGAIGDVVNIQHTEPVGFYHFAHSYVRGNWRNEASSSFSLLTKSCHDLDLIAYWTGKDDRCTKISSFGSLRHFKKENKPDKAGDKCMKCEVETSCAYSARKIYLEPAMRGRSGWPMSVAAGCDDGVVGTELVTKLTSALESGPYGRCVYACDNNVCDNQVVNIEFESGITASFTMIAFTKEICKRKTKIYGTKGVLEFSGDYQVEEFNFLTGATTMHKCTSDVPSTRLWRHGGADFFCVHSFVNAVASNNPSLIMSSPEETLRSHQLVFAAERSRLEEKTLVYDCEHETWS